MTMLSRQKQINSVARKAFTHRLLLTLLVIGLLMGLFDGWYALAGVALYFIASIGLTLNKNFVQKVVKKDRGW